MNMVVIWLRMSNYFRSLYLHLSMPRCARANLLAAKKGRNFYFMMPHIAAMRRYVAS